MDSNQIKYFRYLTIALLFFSFLSICSETALKSHPLGSFFELFYPVLYPFYWLRILLYLIFPSLLLILTCQSSRKNISVLNLFIMLTAPYVFFNTPNEQTYKIIAQIQGSFFWKDFYFYTHSITNGLWKLTIALGIFWLFMTGKKSTI